MRKTSILKAALSGLALSLGSGAAGACGEYDCYNNFYRNITSYDVEADTYTPEGIGLDNPQRQNYQLSPEEVDWQVNDLERCMNESFKTDPVISEEDAKNSYCLRREFYEPIAIKKECLTVKVPDDVYTSVCTGELLFECSIDPQLCIDKGLEPDPRCPCNCRATIQDENTILTEPRLKLFRAELARMATGCNNPWVVTQLRGCLDNPHLIK